MFTLICARLYINGWVNSCESGDLRLNRAHHDVIVMLALFSASTRQSPIAWTNKGQGYCPACRTYLIATRFWVVVICPIIKCHTVLEFSFILYDLCLFITIFNFILNYVPIVTFWIFTFHRIWILLIIFCFIWNYWIIYFWYVWKCFGVLWVNWCQFAVALANKVEIGLAFEKLGIYHIVYFDCIKIINLRGYIDLLDTSVIVFVNNLLWFVFHFMLFA